MMGIPEQNFTTLKKSVDFLLGLEPNHLSTYLLKLEEGTALFDKMDHYAFPDEDQAADFYLFVSEKMRAAGFQHYEISNFAKAGMASRHNLAYWMGEEYLGIGPSAHSFIGGKRFYYRDSLKDFLQKSESITLSIQDEGDGGDLEEALMLRLRLADGISRLELQKIYPSIHTIWERLWDNAAPLEKIGLCRGDSDHIALTEEGFLLSNTCIAKITEGCF